MADMIVEYRVMPDDGEVEYSVLEEVVKKTVQAYDEKLEIRKVESRDVGFGLKAVIINFRVDENKGSEALENSLNELPEVGDVIVELMDRI